MTFQELKQSLFGSPNKIKLYIEQYREKRNSIILSREYVKDFDTFWENIDKIKEALPKSKLNLFYGLVKAEFKTNLQRIDEQIAELEELLKDEEESLI